MTTVYVLQNLLKDGTPAPGPTLLVDYDPEADRFTFRVLSRSLQELWRIQKWGDLPMTFDDRSHAEACLEGLPEPYRSRWGVLELSDERPS